MGTMRNFSMAKGLFPGTVNRAFAEGCLPTSTTVAWTGRWPWCMGFLGQRLDGLCPWPENSALPHSLIGPRETR